MDIVLNIPILLIELWLLAALVLFFHHLSSRLSLIPLIFTLGAYTAALQFRSLGLMIFLPLAPGLVLSIGSFILLPNILLGLLLIYIVHGSTPARNLLLGIILVSLFIGLYQLSPFLELFFPGEITLTQSQITPPARIPISSTITLCLDFIILVVVYQSISNLRSRYPSRLAGCLALLIALIFDAIAFPFFAYIGTPNFIEYFPANLLGKTLAGLAIWPLFIPYLNSIPNAFPLSLASSQRPLLDIFVSPILEYEHNLLSLNQLTTNLVQLHDPQEIFLTITQAGDKILYSDASIIYLFQSQGINSLSFHVHNLDHERSKCLIDSLHQMITHHPLTRDQSWSIEDITKLEGFTDCKTYLHELGYRSAMLLPIYQYETFSGIFLLLFRKIHKFTNAQSQLALTVTNSLSIALQNAHLYQSEYNQRHFAEALVHATAVLNSTLELEQLLERILEQIIKVVPCRSANLMLVEENQATIVRQLQRQPNGEYISLSSGTSIPLSTPSLQQMVNSGSPILISDTQSHPLWKDLGTSDWISCYAGAPLQIRGLTIGFLGVNSDRAYDFNAETTNRLQAFASHAAAALHNARLYQHLEGHSIQLEQHVRQRTTELTAAKNRIEVILKAIPEAVFVIDAEDQLLEVNQAGVLLFNQAEAVDFDLFNPSLLNQLKKGEFNDETRIIEVNQRAYQVLASPFPITKDQTGLVIVYRDVTRFRELDQMKNQFVSDVSHELRTPLTNLSLYLDLLGSEQQEDLRKNYYDTLQRETQRLTILIDDLLTISRIESGSYRIHNKPVDISILITDLVNDRAQMAANRSLELNLKLQADLPMATTDPHSLNQVLSNLLTNSLIYTLPGGSIWLKADFIKLDTGPWIKISISDTGVGIRAEEMRYIFDRFYRGYASQLTNAPGTGLGLAISKEILERMGGRIQVESTPGNGSTFMVWVRAML